jgi:uncharacterized membrane protein
LEKVDTTKQAPGQRSKQTTGQRWLWFVAIWAGSVLALTAVSKVIRWAIMP